MTVSAQDVRDARFGTTRVRAGYNMSEVDAFLDQVEAAIGQYAEDNQRVGDEADVLRSQVQQLQARLAATQQELQDLQNSHASARPHGDDDGHATLVTPLPDNETTAENPVVASNQVGQPSSQGGAPSGLEQLIEIRDRVREMLQRQLSIVEEIAIESPVTSQAPDEAQLN